MQLADATPDYDALLACFAPPAPALHLLAAAAATLNWLITLRTPGSMRTMAAAIRWAAAVGTSPDNVNSPGLPTATVTPLNWGRLVSNEEKRVSSDVLIVVIERDWKVNATR